MVPVPDTLVLRYRVQRPIEMKTGPYVPRLLMELAQVLMAKTS